MITFTYSVPFRNGSILNFTHPTIKVLVSNEGKVIDYYGPAAPIFINISKIRALEIARFGNATNISFSPATFSTYINPPGSCLIGYNSSYDSVYNYFNTTACPGLLSGGPLYWHIEDIYQYGNSHIIGDGEIDINATSGNIISATAID